MAELSIINSESWTEFGPPENGIKILLNGQNSAQKMAHFKPLLRREGPNAANEFLASKLASLVNFPAAEVQLLDFGGELGCISLHIPNSNPWQVFPDKINPRSILVDPTVLAKILSFDMWILSRDRHDKNIIFQSMGAGKYQVFMIDNENSLYGTQAGPPNADDYSGIIQIMDFARQLPSVDELTAQGELIKAVPDGAIIEMVDDFRTAAPNYLDQAQSEIIKSLLIKRKTTLPVKLAEWYNSGVWK